MTLSRHKRGGGSKGTRCVTRARLRSCIMLTTIACQRNGAAARVNAKGRFAHSVGRRTSPTGVSPEAPLSRDVAPALASEGQGRRSCALNACGRWSVVAVSPLRQLTLWHRRAGPRSGWDFESFGTLQRKHRAHAHGGKAEVRPEGIVLSGARGIPMWQAHSRALLILYATHSDNSYSRPSNTEIKWGPSTLFIAFALTARAGAAHHLMRLSACVEIAKPTCRAIMPPVSASVSRPEHAWAFARSARRAD
jgi:hypothetical protein